MKKSKCVVCREPNHGEDRGLDCTSCELSAARHERLIGVSGSSDFVYHEVAHFVMLYCCIPRTREDFDGIETSIDLFTVGRSQLHECRTLALQHVTHKKMGWRPSVQRSVRLVWSGLRRVEGDRGRKVIHTETQACRVVKAMIPTISPRKARLYENALRDLRRP